MMINGRNHSDLSEKMQRCQNHIQALEEERTKIQVFQRELPLCLELVTQAIEACKQQLSGTSSEHNLDGQSECSEQTCSDLPVLEEFIPIKRASSQSDGEEQDSCKKPKNDTNFDINSNNNDEKISTDDKYSKKSDWLRSAQLWNQSPDPPSKEDLASKTAIMEVKKNGNCGAFHPFKKEKSVAKTAPPVTTAASPASTSSTAGSGGGNKKEERKSRRCWSTELHKRFLQALQQLGGSHVATPKQIRELMKVDGLTNDEVKSHLQKYRLHTRRPTPSNHNNNTQTPQFVVVGGLWVPPEYASMAAPATSNGIYAPIAALPPPFQGSSSTSHKQKQQNKTSHSDGRGCSRSDGGGVQQSHSSATSSSTHTTTDTPAY